MNKEIKAEKKTKTAFVYWAVIFMAVLLMLGEAVFAQTPKETTANNGGKWYSGFSSLFSEISAEDAGMRPRVQPHFNFNQGFVSNADLGHHQSDAAWQARIAPGIGISMPWDRLLAEVDYTYAFSTTQGRKTHANMNTHNLDALLRYELTDKTTLGVSNNIQWSEVPGFINDYFMLESLVTQLQHEFSDKLTADTNYTFQYFGDESRNETGAGTRENTFVDNGVSEKVTYDVTEKVSILPGFSWNIRNFEKVQDKDYWQISPDLGTSIKLGSKTQLGGHFGWAYRRFQNNSRGVDNYESEIVYGASLTHLLGHKLTWNLGYNKKLTDTYDTDYIYREDAETTPLDNFDRNFRVVKAHRIDTSMSYHINEKFTTGVFADFQFVEGQKDDNVITGRKNNEKTMETGFSFSYKLFRWASLDLFYSFGRRFSSDDEISLARRTYTFHRVTGGLNIQI